MKNRAMIYYHIFDEIREEFGEEKATEIMKRAIYKRGLDVSKMLAEFGPADLKGLKDAFLTRIVPDEGRLHEPELRRCDNEALEIKFGRCPLKEAHQEAGLGEEEMAKMLEIAAQIDKGTFEGRGSTSQSRPGNLESKDVAIYIFARENKRHENTMMQRISSIRQIERLSKRRL